MHHSRTELRSKQQHIRLFGLLGKLGLGNDTRHTLVHAFTNSRTTSSKEMTEWECNMLINHLEGMVPKTDNPLFLQRRKVFALAHELGWELKGGEVDKTRLQAFIDKRGVAKKPLMKHSSKELRDLITQLERVSATQATERAHG